MTPKGILSNVMVISFLSKAYDLSGPLALYLFVPFRMWGLAIQVPIVHWSGNVAMQDHVLN